MERCDKICGAAICTNNVNPPATLARLVNLEYEGMQGKEKLRVDCEELAEYLGVEETGEGRNEVGKAVGRALKAMNFVKDGL